LLIASFLLSSIIFQASKIASTGSILFFCACLSILISPKLLEIVVAFAILHFSRLFFLSYKTCVAFTERAKSTVASFKLLADCFTSVKSQPKNSKSAKKLPAL